MTAAGEPLGIAIVGAGLMGRQHAASVAGCDASELVGVYAHDEDQAGALSRAHGVKTWASFDEVLADDAVEAVIFATPTDTHAMLATTAMYAGKHAFVEKPVTRTIEDALALRAAARATGRALGVGHVIRYFPDYRGIAAALERGAIGAPAVATFGRRCQQPDWAPDGWHTSMARSGGVAVDMLIHDVDLVRWYFGEPSRVYARVVGSDRHAGLDYALATLTVEGGPICHLHGSWAEPTGFSQSAEICGPDGMISYDSRGRDELSFAAHGASDAATALPPPPPGPTDPFRRQVADFVRACRTREPMPGDIDWAIGSLRIVLAMLESSDRRDVVALESLGAFFAQVDATERASGAVTEVANGGRA